MYVAVLIFTMYKTEDIRMNGIENSKTAKEKEHER